MSTTGDGGATGGTITAPVMDHLALASRRAWDNVARYCGELGGRWLGGPTELDVDPFYFCQVEFLGGTKLEFIEPYENPGSDFIRRFLHRNGPGPHHITFKVPDIEEMMARSVDAGYEIVNADLSGDDWKEAFLHPKQSHGIVIQLAQLGPNAGWEDAPPLPPTDQGTNTTIDGLTHLVADLDRAVELFGGVLAMTELDRTEGPMGSAVTMGSGPWKLRLVAPTADPVQQWLGTRSGRLLQIEMSVDHLGALPRLRPLGDGYELTPEQNLGTRLLLRQNSA